MSIFKRFINFMSLSTNETLDNEGSIDLSFRKTLRALEEQIKLKEDDFNTRAEQRKHTRNKLDRYNKACDRLKKKAALAGSKSNENKILTRWTPLLEKKTKKTSYKLNLIDREILNILEEVEELRDQYEQITIYARNYFLSTDNNLQNTEIFKSFLQKAS